MQSVDQEVLTQVRHWLRDGQRCWLATVVATYGSSPRPEGSLMACNHNHQIVGSLSGGCVEDDLQEKLTKGELATASPQFFRYGESEEEAEQLGLPCGGHLDIVVEPLDSDTDTAQAFEEIVSCLESRNLAFRRVNLTSGSMEVKRTSSYIPFRFERDLTLIEQTYGPRYQLFIIGTGMVSEYVASFAQILDYQVTVIDPREERLRDFSVDGAIKVCDMPDDVLRARANDAQTAIVALSHDPRIDDMGLLGAFDTEAFYIGAMGSNRTSAKRRERLIELEVAQDQMDRLHAPIGIPIGSKTPPEIAISVVAQITSIRNALQGDGSIAQSVAEGNVTANVG